MDRVLIGPFDIIAVNQYFVGVGGRKSQNNGLVTGDLLFSHPLVSRASLSREMPRSPRLAHKAPILQAIHVQQQTNKSFAFMRL